MKRIVIALPRDLMDAVDVAARGIGKKRIQVVWNCGLKGTPIDAIQQLANPNKQHRWRDHD